ncbi:MAG: hypothetical protein GKR99_11310 [Rhodobacteraceae bacterium]|nr:hypothetical protein [Paracoccaceae bacterium]
MKKLRNLWDSILSFIAAILTGVICFVPVWASYRAIDDGLVPIWVWGAIIALGLVGLVMIAAFLRKARDGVSPLRDRKRR